MKPIRAMVFPGAHNLPLYMMQDVELVYTKSRDEQISAIQDQLVDIIHTSPDNLALDDASGLVPFLSGTVGPLSLIATSGEVSDHRLGVDNARSGFGKLAYAWLEKHRPTLRYDVVEVGGTPQRFEALQTKKVTMIVTHPPFTQFCERLGYDNWGRIDHGQLTLCGVHHIRHTNPCIVDQYREQYRKAITTLASPDGFEIALALIEQHIHPPADTLHTMTQVMREEIIRAGVDIQNEP